jgi:probable HAF family extracellular repeat protein
MPVPRRRDWLHRIVGFYERQSSATFLGVMISIAGGACGGGSEEPPSGTTTAISEILISNKPAGDSLETGGLVTLRAEALDSRRTVIVNLPAPVWSTGTPELVSVNATSGEVRALKAGSATVTATINATAATYPLRVVVRTASVSVTPKTVTLLTEETRQLTAQALDASGAAIADRTVAWESRTPAVASVSNSGLVTALTAGQAVIVATSEGRRDSATFTVRARVARVRVDAPNGTSLEAGTALPLTAVALDASGGVLSGRPIVWSSAASSIATVDSTGRVVGVRPGTADITATSEGRSASVTVRVIVPPLSIVGFTTPVAGGGARLRRWALDGSSVDLGPVVLPIASGNVVRQNDHGQIVATRVGTGGVGRGFVYTVANGAVELPSLGGASTAEAVNNEGLIVGRAANAAGDFQAVAWQDGVLIRLPRLAGETQSRAAAINNVGAIAGASTVGGTEHAVLWPSGASSQAQDLHDAVVRGASAGDVIRQSEAVAISSVGQVLIRAVTASDQIRCFIWAIGSAQDLSPIVLQSVPAENRAGCAPFDMVGNNVVGSYTLTNGTSLPFLLNISDRTVVRLAIISGSFGHARGVNEAGDVVGRTLQGGRNVAVIWRAGAYDAPRVLAGGTFDSAEVISNPR